VALDDALEALEALDPRQHRVVELKYFMGLTLEQIADVLDVAKSTVIRDWANARVFLQRELNRSEGSGDADDPSP
jgi:RNA polymerase sigma factor (sigma-70 family)